MLRRGFDQFAMVSRGAARPQMVAAARRIAGTVAWLAAGPLIQSLRNWRVTQAQQDYCHAPEAMANLGCRHAAPGAPALSVGGGG